jgi:competence protein ComFB
VVHKVKIINVVESMVWEAMDSVLDQKPGICRCEKCRTDIAAYALNQLNPRYATSKLGEVLVKTASLDQNIHVAILVALTEAVEVVSTNPRHKKESVSE